MAILELLAALISPRLRAMRCAHPTTERQTTGLCLPTVNGCRGCVKPGRIASTVDPWHMFRSRMKLTIELEQEVDGRWIAEVPELPGVLAYGDTQDKAAQLARALAFRVLADQLEAGEIDARSVNSVSFAA
jgi:predicted RNase H-like HicB family nuclease